MIKGKTSVLSGSSGPWVVEREAGLAVADGGRRDAARGPYDLAADSPVFLYLQKLLLVPRPRLGLVPLLLDPMLRKITFEVTRNSPACRPLLVSAISRVFPPP